jgi:1,4-dihydroxy-2-naphthoyl-CoA synthase
LRTGLANIVVPRAELEKETLALANRIAETDSFTLRLLKFAINNAHDEMGFRTSVRNAHSHHFLTRVQDYSKMDRGDAGPIKRLPGVEQALKRVRPTAAK